jgi:dipeptidyl aminopeptidase/acylaminoacyl peptidase
VVRYVQAAGSMPPAWLVHGESDCTVPPGQSQQLLEALKGKGFEATLSYVPGAGHSDPKITDQATRPTIEFLRRVLNAPRTG